MQNRQTSQVRMMMKAIPPTTPPAIAPTFVFLDDVGDDEPDGPAALFFRIQVVEGH